MLQITIPGAEYYDEITGTFVESKSQSLQLEHSLISISKWESKWKKPFLFIKEPRTTQESIDYIRCMTLTQNVDPRCYFNVTREIFDEVNAYIDDSMTATWFNNKNQKPNREIVTSEVIYYWMISLGIPFECQKWHFNRLMTLIRVCNIKDNPPAKANRRQMMEENRALNNARRQNLRTRG